MIRRRSSIKGIGASIFYDSEPPDDYSRNGDDKPGDEVSETSDREVVSEKPLSSKVSDPYDTGDLISLLEDEARNGGDGQQRESARAREVDELEVLSSRDTEPSLADQESFFHPTRAEVAQPPERIVPLEEWFVAAPPEMKEPPPWEEPAVPEGELEMLRPETRPVEEPAVPEGELEMLRPETWLVEEPAVPEGELEMLQPETRPVEELAVPEGELEMLRPETWPVEEPAVPEGELEMFRPETRPVEEPAVPEGELEMLRPETWPVEEPAVPEGELEMLRPETRPVEEPAVPEEELEMLRPETRPVEEPVPFASGLTPVMPPISYEPHEPVLDDQLTDAKPSDLDSPLGDLKTVSPEQEERAWKRLGEHAFQNLLQEINVLYERITVSLSTRPDMAQRSMDLLSEARDLLLLGNAGDFNLAERRVNEAKMMLNQVERTRRWGNTYGWVLFLYELIVLGVLVVALLFDQHIAEWLSLMTGTYTVTNGVAELTKSMVEIFPPWNTMLWGGIGGVVGALYSLHWHVSELQDFDKQYSLWYVVQPLMGLILGGIIHLVIVTGLLALIPGSGSNADPTVAVQWFPILIACLAGFRQKFAYELLDSIMKAFGRQPVSSAKV